MLYLVLILFKTNGAVPVLDEHCHPFFWVCLLEFEAVVIAAYGVVWPVHDFPVAPVACLC